MNWHDVALVVAGIIGSGVALVHGILTQRLMVRPLANSESLLPDAGIRWIMPRLLQFSTFNWFIGGLALIASIWFGRDVRIVIGLLVGSSYLYGAFIALWATRGRHPAWMLYAVALGLIAFGVNGSGD
ncbi:hypothetical protein [Brevibacillus fortis]|uniref:hypothetical protein n=1 Tax=Brevibacillus fortis TaxID=2126352 RepID=UPI0038FC0CC9